MVEAIREKRPDSKVVVLTGYGAIATAVAALVAEYDPWGGRRG